MTQPGACPEPGLHGNPFRYCPSCTWTGEPAKPVPLVRRPPGDVPAAAAYGAFRISVRDRLGGMPPWDALPPEVRADWRAVADAVLMITGMTGATGYDGPVTAGDLVTPADGTLDVNPAPDRPSSVRGGPLPGRGAADGTT